jgi:glucokinase
LSGLFLDIGGTSFRYLFEDDVHSDGGIFPTDGDFLSHIDELVAKYRPSRLGASFAGQISGGKILSAPNICTGEIDFEAIFRDKYGIITKIDNDLKCAALAEAKGRTGMSSMALLYVGTGFGSAFVDNSRLVRGAANLAGEIGHIPFRTADRACGCGKNNCLELFASGKAVADRVCALGLPKMNLRECKNSEDGRVKAIYDDFFEGLVFAVSSVLALLNPSVIVFGGGVMTQNGWLLDEIKKACKGQAFQKALDQTSFELSSFEDGSLEGAKLLFD